MVKDFAALRKRILALRLTEAEFIKLAGISRVRWWRAKTGKIGDEARMKALREAETLVEKLETDQRK